MPAQSKLSAPVTPAVRFAFPSQQHSAAAPAPHPVALANSSEPPPPPKSSAKPSDCPCPTPLSHHPDSRSGSIWPAVPLTHCPTSQSEACPCARSSLPQVSK